MAQDKTGAPLEIERRWIVTGLDPDVLRHPKKQIVQGYFDSASGGSFRARLINEGTGVLTRKSGRGLVREEREIPVPIETARFILEACQLVLEKERRVIDGWELDTFSGPLSGLVILEREFPSVEAAGDVILPPWAKEAHEVTDSLTNYHLAHLAADLKGSVPDRPVRELLAAKRLPRIVLTGGPCSGKTTVLDVIKQRYGHLVHCVPEVASIVIAQVGIKPPVGDTHAMRNFQRLIARVQESFEDASEAQAIRDGKTALILDRGIPDGAAYVDGGVKVFESIIHRRMDQAYARYDSVLILGLPSREVYLAQSSNNPARSEKFERAVELNEAIQEAWQDHPHSKRVYATADVNNKIMAVIEWIDQVVSLKLPPPV